MSAPVTGEVGFDASAGGLSPAWSGGVSMFKSDITPEDTLVCKLVVTPEAKSDVTRGHKFDVTPESKSAPENKSAPEDKSDITPNVPGHKLDVMPGTPSDIMRVHASPEAKSGSTPGAPFEAKSGSSSGAPSKAKSSCKPGAPSAAKLWYRFSLSCATSFGAELTVARDKMGGGQR